MNYSIAKSAMISELLKEINISHNSVYTGNYFFISRLYNYSTNIFTLMSNEYGEFIIIMDKYLNKIESFFLLKRKKSLMKKNLNLLLTFLFLKMKIIKMKKEIKNLYLSKNFMFF